MPLEVGSEVRSRAQHSQQPVFAAGWLVPLPSRHRVCAGLLLTDALRLQLPAAPQGCQFNYVVSAHKPTAVNHSAVGHFTSPTDLNLVIS